MWVSKVVLLSTVLVCWMWCSWGEVKKVLCSLKWQLCPVICRFQHHVYWMRCLCLISGTSFNHLIAKTYVRTICLKCLCNLGGVNAVEHIHPQYIIRQLLNDHRCTQCESLLFSLYLTWINHANLTSLLHKNYWYSDFLVIIHMVRIDTWIYWTLITL
jgi:hypothetical protein